MVVHLWEPLLADVFERGWGGDGEADKEDVGLWVGEWAQTVVILLSGSIEETESIWLITDPVRPELTLFDDSDTTARERCGYQCSACEGGRGAWYRVS